MSAERADRSSPGSGPAEVPEALARFQAMVARVLGDKHDRPSLVADIACFLGAEILAGIRPPGADINSVELARTFRTSRTPTREALMMLEKQGLVEIPPRRRPRVASPGVKQVEELYKARAAIMRVMVMDASYRIDEAALARLGEVRDQMRQAAAEGDVEAYFWSGLRFHEILAEASGNETMQQILSSLILRTLPYRRLSLAQPQRLQRSFEDHNRLLGALADRDGELASALLTANMMGGFRSIITHLKPREG